MGQLTVGILYGCKIPDDVLLLTEDAEVDGDEGLLDRWAEVNRAEIEAADKAVEGACALYPGVMPYEFESGCDRFVPDMEYDGGEPLMGFWIAAGASGKNGIPRLRALVVDAKKLSTEEPYAKAYRKAVERWDRFAAWAKSRGVKLPKARLWVTQTEVA